MSAADSAISAPSLTDHIAVSLRDTLTMTESMAPSAASERAVTYIGKVPYTDGIVPVPRRELPGYNSGVMTLLIGVFLFITLNLRHYSTFLKTFTQNLFSVRKRANVFDERSTMSETRVLVSLILLTCICEGILLFDMATKTGIVADNFAAIASMSGLALAYYILQYAAYRAVGYIFTTPMRAEMWIKGFSASQSLLGLTMCIPAVLSLFVPSASSAILIICAALYVIARIIFISKGFRIFYHNSFSLVYFILYLCSLEIIPLILIYKASLFLTSNL